MEEFSVRDICVEFRSGGKVFRALDGVSFDLPGGNVLGIVGESGSGKTMTALSILRLVPYPGKIAAGNIIFDGVDLMKLPESEMRKIRGAKIAMVFQDPASALNPVLRIGYQVGEPLMVHRRYSRSAAMSEAIRLLSVVGIPDPKVRARSYPHEFSGGMKQRAVVAASISCSPSLLIADEPTTAVDVTIQAQILNLLKSMVLQRGMSMILISHDVSVVAYMSDFICVMYGGWDVERGMTGDVISDPLHPYTKALLESLPRGRGRPKSLPGSPADISETGCKFAKRCPSVKDICFDFIPQRKEIHGRIVRCHLY